MEFKDYKPWVQNKLSPKFHSDPEDESESELRTIIEDFIEVGNRLDVLKKNKFYGRIKGHPKHVDSGVEVRQSDSAFKKESESEPLLHAIIGMATESVEMLEAIYASKWKGEEFDVVNFFEEMGDLEFYRSIPFNNLNWTEKEVRDTNYFKLEKRYPVGYTDKDATERDLDSERIILEDGLNSHQKKIADSVEKRNKTENPNDSFKTFYGESIVVKSTDFTDGVLSVDFNLKDVYAQIAKEGLEEQYHHLEFVCNNKIEYGEKPVIESYGTIPYYARVGSRENFDWESYDRGRFKKGAANVVLDLRIASIFGKDLDVNKYKTSHESNEIVVTPIIQIFVPK